MHLTRHQTPAGPRWALDDHFLEEGFRLDALLASPAAGIEPALAERRTGEPASGMLLAPVEDGQEVWACGVTYLRSREARVSESQVRDIYEKVYEAERVEVFFKAVGWRVVAPGEPVRIRRDSRWNVPEPELTLVLGSAGEIVGYCAGNDMSSRDIEGENPLYLPQAKIYNGSCAIGPRIVLAGPDAQRDLPIRMRLERAGETVFEGETATSQLKRGLEEMAGWLVKEYAIPGGAFLMTGTCLVPPDEFTLEPGDVVRIEVGELVLENPVSR